MYLFLILAVPLSYLYILMLRGQTGDAASITGVPFLKGALAFLVVLAVMLIARRIVDRPFSGYGIYVFLAGSLSLESILHLFLRGDYFGVYELMLLPSLRVSGIVYASLLYRAFDTEPFWTRYIYLLLFLLLPGLLGAVQLLLGLNIGAAAVSLAGLLFAVTWLLLIVFAGKSNTRARLLR